MESTFKDLTDFLITIGVDEIKHTDKGYLAHAIGVHNDLREWGCGVDLCRAAMFHSIYGTEFFQGFTFPIERRGEIRELIGERAEKLAYWNCAINRKAFDHAVEENQPPHRLLDRFSGQYEEVTPDDFDDLCRIHLCDWLEQVPRSAAWDYRRATYRRLAEKLGGIALKSYDRVFALEAAS